MKWLSQLGEGTVGEGLEQRLPALRDLTERFGFSVAPVTYNCGRCVTLSLGGPFTRFKVLNEVVAQKQ